MSHGFMSVNTKLGAGRAFLKSLYQQYADWGVDFGNLNSLGRNKFVLICTLATSLLLVRGRLGANGLRMDPTST